LPSKTGPKIVQGREPVDQRAESYYFGTKESDDAQTQQSGNIPGLKGGYENSDPIWNSYPVRSGSGRIGVPRAAISRPSHVLKTDREGIQLFGDSELGNMPDRWVTEYPSAVNRFCIRREALYEEPGCHPRRRNTSASRQDAPSTERGLTYSSLGFSSGAPGIQIVL
jgi:hypothetical protein